MRKRVLSIGTVCTLLVTLCLPDYVSTRRDPTGGPDDADLSVIHHNVTAPEDGLRHLLAAVKVCEFDEDDRLLAEAVWRGGDITTGDMASLLDANREALAHLRRTLEAPHFRLPELSADDFDVVPEIPIETESLIALLRFESLYLARSEDWDGAFNSAVDILRFAQRIEGANHAALTTTMLSVGYRSMGLETLRRLASLAPLENEQAKHWVETLPSFRSDPSAWKRMWAVEYQQWKALLGWIAERAEHDFRSGQGAVKAPEFTLLDIAALRSENARTLEAFAAVTRTYQRASELDCSDMTSIPFPDDPWDTSAPRFEGPGAGDSEIALEIATPDYRDFFIKRCAEDTALAATQTLIALRAYQQDNNRLPEGLNDLVPGYLESIPTDSFGGKPLRYSRAHKRVYSTGAEGATNARFEIEGKATSVHALSYPIEF
jgi:hypothetical protein